jgi:hypothetical protein
VFEVAKIAAHTVEIKQDLCFYFSTVETIIEIAKIESTEAI